MSAQDLTGKAQYLLLEERKYTQRQVSLLTGPKNEKPAILAVKSEKDLGVRYLALKNADSDNKLRRAIYSCEFCYKDFDELGQKLLHREKRHRCKVCDKVHKDGDYYCKIMRVNMIDRKVKLKIESLQLDVNRKMKIQKTEFGIKLRTRDCPFCRFQAFNDHDLRRHCRKKHSLRCRKCRKYFKTDKDLILHQKYCFQKFICDLCDQVFYKKEELKAHKKLCENEFKINLNLSKCIKCDFSSAKRENIRRHMVKQHPEVKQDRLKPFNYKCDTCQKLFTKKIKLLAHQKKANHIMPSLKYRSTNVLFPCNVCFKLDMKSVCFQTVSSDDYLGAK